MSSVTAAWVIDRFPPQKKNRRRKTKQRNVNNKKKIENENKT